MRCNSCNKFVGVDSDSDPEVSVDLEGSTITGTVEIQNNCAECGDTLRTASFDIEEEVSGVEEHATETKQKVEQIEEKLKLTADDASREVKTEGKGRGTKTFYGFVLNYTVECECAFCTKHPDKAFSAEGSISDYCQASSMDEY